MDAATPQSTPPQIVTLSLMRYTSTASRWWAFVQMGIGPAKFAGVPGLSFVKMLGSGGGNGFSIWPNWGVYGLLCVWESATPEASAQRFFNTHPWWGAARQRAAETCVVYLQPTAAHGRWDGRSPFRAGLPFNPDSPVAVLTRATIRLRHLWRFWRYVPRVSASVKDRPGELLSVGVGEWPLFQQATFSIWQSGHQMMDYAYRSPFHSEVVKRTRELGWYKEELFARFAPVRAEGSWNGANPLGRIAP